MKIDWNEENRILARMQERNTIIRMLKKLNTEDYRRLGQIDMEKKKNEKHD